MSFMVKSRIDLLKEDIISICNHNNEPLIINNLNGWHFYYYAIRLFKNDLNGFRSLLYYRIPNLRFLKLIFKPAHDVVLWIGDLEGGGLIFHHPFATVVNAEHIGHGCIVRNNTTIGVIGAGNVGEKVARLAETLGFRVLRNDLYSII